MWADMLVKKTKDYEARLKEQRTGSGDVAFRERYKNFTSPQAQKKYEQKVKEGRMNVTEGVRARYKNFTAPQTPTESEPEQSIDSTDLNPLLEKILISIDQLGKDVKEVRAGLDENKSSTDLLRWTTQRQLKAFEDIPDMIEGQRKHLEKLEDQNRFRHVEMGKEFNAFCSKVKENVAEASGEQMDTLKKILHDEHGLNIESILDDVRKDQKDLHEATKKSITKNFNTMNHMLGHTTTITETITGIEERVYGKEDKIAKAVKNEFMTFHDWCSKWTKTTENFMDDIFKRQRDMHRDLLHHKNTLINTFRTMGVELKSLPPQQGIKRSTSPSRLMDTESEDFKKFATELEKKLVEGLNKNTNTVDEKLETITKSITNTPMTLTEDSLSKLQSMFVAERSKSMTSLELDDVKSDDTKTTAATSAVIDKLNSTLIDLQKREEEAISIINQLQDACTSVHELNEKKENETERLHDRLDESLKKIKKKGKGSSWSLFGKEESSATSSGSDLDECVYEGIPENYQYTMVLEVYDSDIGNDGFMGEAWISSIASYTDLTNLQPFIGEAPEDTRPLPDEKKVPDDKKRKRKMAAGGVRKGQLDIDLQWKFPSALDSPKKNDKKGILTLQIKSASDLVTMKSSMLGVAPRPDPYIAVYLRNDITGKWTPAMIDKKAIKTKHINATVDPVWNEYFEIEIPANFSQQKPSHPFVADDSVPITNADSGVIVTYINDLKKDIVTYNNDVSGSIIKIGDGLGKVPEILEAMQVKLNTMGKQLQDTHKSIDSLNKLEIVPAPAPEPVKKNSSWNIFGKTEKPPIPISSSSSESDIEEFIYLGMPENFQYTMVLEVYDSDIGNDGFMGEAWIPSIASYACLTTLQPNIEEAPQDTRPLPNEIKTPDDKKLKIKPVAGGTRKGIFSLEMQWRYLAPEQVSPKMKDIKGRLILSINSASNLVTMKSGMASMVGMQTKPDPYVVVYLRDEITGKWTQIIETKHINRTLDPEWNESFEIDIPANYLQKKPVAPKEQKVLYPVPDSVPIPDSLPVPVYSHPPPIVDIDSMMMCIDNLRRDLLTSNHQVSGSVLHIGTDLQKVPDILNTIQGKLDLMGQHVLKLGDGLGKVPEILAEIQNKLNTIGTQAKSGPAEALEDAIEDVFDKVGAVEKLLQDIQKNTVSQKDLEKTFAQLQQAPKGGGSDATSSPAPVENALKELCDKVNVVEKLIQNAHDGMVVTGAPPVSPSASASPTALKEQLREQVRLLEKVMAQNGSINPSQKDTLLQIQKKIDTLPSLLDKKMESLQSSIESRVGPPPPPASKTNAPSSPSSVPATAATKIPAPSPPSPSMSTHRLGSLLESHQKIIIQLLTGVDVTQKHTSKDNDTIQTILEEKMFGVLLKAVLAICDGPFSQSVAFAWHRVMTSAAPSIVASADPTLATILEEKIDSFPILLAEGWKVESVESPYRLEIIVVEACQKLYLTRMLGMVEIPQESVPAKKKVKSDEEAAIKIQAHARGNRTRKEVQNKKLELQFKKDDPELEKAATRIQSQRRGQMARKASPKAVGAAQSKSVAKPKTKAKAKSKPPPDKTDGAWSNFLQKIAKLRPKTINIQWWKELIHDLMAKGINRDKNAWRHAAIKKNGTLHTAFKHVDRNRSGTISMSEFILNVHEMMPPLADLDVLKLLTGCEKKQLFRHIDQDGNGVINCLEFVGEFDLPTPSSSSTAPVKEEVKITTADPEVVKASWDAISFMILQNLPTETLNLRWYREAVAFMIEQRIPRGIDIWRVVATRRHKSLEKTFQFMDVSTNGTICASEFKRVMTLLMPPFAGEQGCKVLTGFTQAQIFKMLDADGDGEITLKEFLGGYKDIANARPPLDPDPPRTPPAAPTKLSAPSTGPVSPPKPPPGPPPGAPPQIPELTAPIQAVQSSIHALTVLMEQVKGNQNQTITSPIVVNESSTGADMSPHFKSIEQTLQEILSLLKQQGTQFDNLYKKDIHELHKILQKQQETLSDVVEITDDAFDSDDCDKILSRYFTTVSSDLQNQTDLLKQCVAVGVNTLLNQSPSHDNNSHADAGINDQLVLHGRVLEQVMHAIRAIETGLNTVIQVQQQTRVVPPNEHLLQKLDTKTELVEKRSLEINNLISNLSTTLHDLKTFTFHNLEGKIDNIDSAVRAVGNVVAEIHEGPNTYQESSSSLSGSDSDDGEKKKKPKEKSVAEKGEEEKTPKSVEKRSYSIDDSMAQTRSTLKKVEEEVAKMQTQTMKVHSDQNMALGHVSQSQEVHRNILQDMDTKVTMADRSLEFIKEKSELNARDQHNIISLIIRLEQSVHKIQSQLGDRHGPVSASGLRSADNTTLAQLLLGSPRSGSNTSVATAPQASPRPAVEFQPLLSPRPPFHSELVADAIRPLESSQLASSNPEVASTILSLAKAPGGPLTAAAPYPGFVSTPLGLGGPLAAQPTALPPPNSSSPYGAGFGQPPAAQPTASIPLSAMGSAAYTGYGAASIPLSAMGAAAAKPTPPYGAGLAQPPAAMGPGGLGQPPAAQPTASIPLSAMGPGGPLAAQPTASIPLSAMGAAAAKPTPPYGAASIPLSAMGLGPSSSSPASHEAASMSPAGVAPGLGSNSSSLEISPVTHDNPTASTASGNVAPTENGVPKDTEATLDPNSEDSEMSSKSGYSVPSILKKDGENSRENSPSRRISFSSNLVETRSIEVADDAHLRSLPPTSNKPPEKKDDKKNPKGPPTPPPLPPPKQLPTQTEFSSNSSDKKQEM